MTRFCYRHQKSCEWYLYNESELYSVEDYFKAIEASGFEMQSKEILKTYKLEFANIADFKVDR